MVCNVLEDTQLQIDYVENKKKSIILIINYTCMIFLIYLRICTKSITEPFSFFYRPKMSQKHPISPIKNPPDSKRPNSSVGNKVITRGATKINPISVLRTFDSMILTPSAAFSGSKLPTNAEILERIFYEKDHGDTQNNKPTNSVIDDILPEIEAIYDKVPCPMKRKDKCKAKIVKLHDKWQNLSKNIGNGLPNSAIISFKEELCSLCDLSAQDAVDQIGVDRARTPAQRKQDIDFLQDQKTTRIGKLQPTVDKSYVKRKERKEMRDQEVKSALSKPTTTKSSTTTSHELSDSESEEKEEQDSDYKLPVSRSSRHRDKSLVSNRKVTASLDRAGLSLRDSTRVLASAAEATGSDLRDTTISKSTLGRQRSKSRAEIGKCIFI